MKSRVTKYCLYLMVIMLPVLLASCSSPSLPSDDVVLDEEIVSDKPTIPENMAEGIEYLYDFRFSDRYDANITDDFSFVLPDSASPIPGILFLFEKYQSALEAAKEFSQDGDGMVPYIHKKYWYTLDAGGLMIGTDYYEPDNVEYISYLWADVEGVKTNRDVLVGSTEEELLSSYMDDLYYLNKEEALSETGFIGYQEENIESLDKNSDFEYAYMWQPFAPETNEIRDITFYIKNGKVAAIEMIRPFELRYVYGYDRDAGLQHTAEKRKD